MEHTSEKRPFDAIIGFAHIEFNCHTTASALGLGLNIVDDYERKPMLLHLKGFNSFTLNLLAMFLYFVQLLGAGGGMYVEVLNKGVLPLAYSIKKKNRAGESNTYLDGIHLIFTYFTGNSTYR
ncbi:hypothetical protein CDL12_11328 [Handroanthus impetiginosus]|uniref:Uncharacterized protein n=1 Tax=Handroanthus impetiginosus TaxID=429701 RepID=A0A2G9HER7_9LAMI|nr:hypothetical protein CDL12_11328 [Handroanthus impetiginosus]